MNKDFYIKALNRILEFGFKEWGGRISTKDQIMLAKRCAFLMSGNVSILEAFQIIRNQSDSRRYRRILDVIIDDISNGKSLSKSMSKFPMAFSNFVVNIVRAGEIGGMLSQNLDYLAQELTKKNALRRKIVSSFFYPTIITFATLGIVIFLVLYLFPKLIPILLSLRIDLPLSTRVIMWISSFLRSHGLAFFIIVTVILILTWIFFNKSEKAKLFMTKILMKIPFIGKILRCYNLSNFCRTCGLLLKSGISLKDVVVLSAESSTNIIYRDSFFELANAIDRGQSLSSYFKKYPDIFPGIFSSMVTVGERSGALPDSLIYLSEHYQSELEQFTKDLSSAIEPILMIVMGLLVGFIAVSIITPIYSITQNLRL